MMGGAAGAAGAAGGGAAGAAGAAGATGAAGGVGLEGNANIQKIVEQSVHKHLGAGGFNLQQMVQQNLGASGGVGVEGVVNGLMESMSQSGAMNTMVSEVMGFRCAVVFSRLNPIALNPSRATPQGSRVRWQSLQASFCR